MMHDDGGVAERLRGWLHSRLPGADDVVVEGLDRVTFGHSAEMMVLTIVVRRGADEERHDAVLRLRPTPPALLEPYDLPRQYRILKALADTAVRVPRVMWLDASGEVLGRPFLIMERVAGTVYEMDVPQGDVVTPARIRRMCESLAEQLAAIHSVDLDATGLRELDDPATHLEREIEHWAGEMHRVQRGPLPALERLLQTLRDTVPAPSPRVTLVHGDAKPGNFAFVGDEVSAVFDWEMTTVGDPLTDIGWMELLCMQPVGLTSHENALSIDDFIAHYEAVSGITVENRPWYRAFNAYKMAVICLIGAMLFDEGRSDDMKLVLAAAGANLLTQVGLADLGVTEQIEAGPVDIRPERLAEVTSLEPTVP
ncbi:acyl-CoA dehydrogenase [Mycolicibacterium monacense]|uniref:Acyl-CoA dehydrogenase n=2 Tax=Mycolicibacterium monacense TaxID=85693 RepID=A0AAD1MXE1_MYCMB|nr:acyl-CoA dehydrogenase [Mycolicibacterium monacense DSM 44395]BBZ61358.1 acyl-CoA dehydrogenase [Mycolicibacterium monacense]